MTWGGEKHTPEHLALYDTVAKDLTAGTAGCPDTGLTYAELPVEQRVIVMQLAHQRSMDLALGNIDVSTDEIDRSMREVRDWFKLSKPYYP